MLLEVANFPALLAKSVDRMAFFSYGWGAVGEVRHRDEKEAFGSQLQCTQMRGQRNIQGTLMVGVTIT